MTFTKPTLNDLSTINTILTQWTDQEEVEKYLQRIENEINGKTEYGMQFWVLQDDDQVVGVAGLADILPKIKEFSQTYNPCEIKILYLDKNQRGKGYGKSFLDFLESEAVERGRTEILVRSATLYKDTAWGFYEKFDYKRCGTIDTDMAVFRKILQNQ